MTKQKKINYFQQALKMLVNQLDRSQNYLEGLKEDFVQSNSETTKLYQHYWMSNIGLKNTIDLLKILNVEQKSNQSGTFNVGSLDMNNPKYLEKRMNENHLQAVRLATRNDELHQENERLKEQLKTWEEACDCGYE